LNSNTILSNHEKNSDDILDQVQKEASNSKTRKTNDDIQFSFNNNI